MKKIKIIFFSIIILFTFNVYGSSGTINQKSIIFCNDKYYGSHGNPTHWHIVEKKGDKWISVSDEVNIPACYVKKINEKEQVIFSKCSDGDTAHFLINGKDKIVRFLAIDTPEVNNKEKGTERFGKEASEYTCKALKSAKEIYLEYDSNSDKEDKYGRILAFVYVDGILLEKSLVEQGLARVYYIYGDYDHVDELRDIEEIAKSKKIGIWSDNVAIGDRQGDTNKMESSNENEDNLLIVILKIVIKIIKNVIALLEK